MTAPRSSHPDKSSAIPASPLCDFLDLKAQFATIREEVMAAVTKVMETQLSVAPQARTP